MKLISQKKFLEKEYFVNTSHSLHDRSGVQSTRKLFLHRDEIFVCKWTATCFESDTKMNSEYNTPFKLTFAQIFNAKEKSDENMLFILQLQGDWIELQIYKQQLLHFKFYIEYHSFPFVISFASLQFWAPDTIRWIIPIILVMWNIMWVERTGFEFNSKFCHFEHTYAQRLYSLFYPLFLDSER